MTYDNAIRTDQVQEHDHCSGIKSLRKTGSILNQRLVTFEEQDLSAELLVIVGGDGEPW